MKKINQAIVLFSLMLFCWPAFAANISFGPNGCTLQDAIRSANADAARGNCIAGSGRDNLISPDVWTITLSSSLPAITSDLTIKTTTTAGLLTISGDDNHQIMTITGSSTDVTLTRVNITKGASSSVRGAGIHISDANVTLLDSIVGFNTTTAKFGAGVYIENGTLNIENSSFEYNTAQNTDLQSSGGGGVYAKNSDVTVIKSKFIKNEAEYRLRNLQGQIRFWDFGFGASIYMEEGSLAVSDSLFSEDHSAIHGERAVATIENSTVAKLAWPSGEDQRGHIFFTDFSALTLNHVTMKSAFRIEGNSLLSMTNTILTHECNISENTTWIVDAGNLYNTANYLCPGKGNLFFYPNLLGLADNGGDTLTFALELSSDAVNAGNPTYCLPTDQRGVARDAACDIGAYEVADYVDIEVSGELDKSAPYVHDQTLIYEATIKNNSQTTANEIRINLSINNATITAVDHSLCSSFPCTLTNIQGSQEITIPVHVSLATLNNDFEFNLSATKTANSNFTDTNLSNDAHQLAGNIINGADMSIHMALSTQTDHYIGEAIYYAVTVTNLGFNTAQNVSFDLSTVGLTFSSFSGCTSVSGQTCLLGSMVKNATKNITVLAQMNASQFDAEVEVTSSVFDVNSDNNIDLRDNNGALGLTDIAVGIADVIGSPFYSDTYVEFSIKVSTGDKSATNIRVWPDYPDASFIACSHYFNLDGYCEIPAIAANESEFVTFQYFNPFIPPNGSLQRTFSVTALPGETDTKLNNNSDSVNLNVSSTADMVAQLSLLTQPPYFDGQELEFHLRVLNNGINTARLVDIDVVPDNLTLLWMAGNLCNTEHCNIDAMELSNEENMVLVYRIDNAGDFSLSATVDAYYADLVPSNNVDVINGTAELATRSNTIFTGDFEN